MMRARGVAARGARPLAAATCWTRRRVARPRPARLLAGSWGVMAGGCRGPLYPGASRGVLERFFPLPQCRGLCGDSVREIKQSLGGAVKKGWVL